LFHSKDGLIHMGISPSADSKFKLEHLLEPVRQVQNYIKSSNAQNILELAPGRGANSYYLATQFPSKEFQGLDLIQKQLPKYKTAKNYSHTFGDYHNLSKFKDNEF